MYRINDENINSMKIEKGPESIPTHSNFREIFSTMREFK